MLLVPDSIHWITGTLARSFIAHNEWVDGTIISGPVLDVVARENPNLFDSFDLVHFVCPYASRTWLARLRDRLPVVTSHHHVSDSWELQRHNLEGDAIIVGSREWQADVAERGADPQRVVCIPYGVDAARFVPPTLEGRASVRSHLGIAPDSFVVGFFAKRSSNEHDRKGTDIFAAAVQLLAKELPQLTVLIIGPGWDDLVAQLTAAGVTCIWQPFVREASRMPSMYQALDFYWVTARVEGGPVTLLEAMSSGVCCITTPVGLAREIVESDVNGITVPFDDSRAFARHTLELSRDAKRRTTLSTHARSTILAVMDIPVTAKGIGMAYDVAIEHFEERTAVARAEHAKHSLSPALSKPLLSRISLIEQLAWAEALMLQGQRVLALRIIAETWLKYPLSSLPPRYLLRNALPAWIVKAMVRAKVRVAGSAS
ncbi:MAG: glycosyltransferase family 4 protein [Gemmatimonadota bacterium]